MKVKLGCTSGWGGCMYGTFENVRNDEHEHIQTRSYKLISIEVGSCLAWHILHFKPLYPITCMWHKLKIKAMHSMRLFQILTSQVVITEKKWFLQWIATKNETNNYDFSMKTFIFRAILKYSQIFKVNSNVKKIRHSIIII